MLYSYPNVVTLVSIFDLEITFEFQSEIFANTIIGVGKT